MVDSLTLLFGKKRRTKSPRRGKKLRKGSYVVVGGRKRTLHKGKQGGLYYVQKGKKSYVPKRVLKSKRHLLSPRHGKKLRRRRRKARKSRRRRRKGRKTRRRRRKGRKGRKRRKGRKGRKGRKKLKMTKSAKAARRYYRKHRAKILRKQRKRKSRFGESSWSWF